MNECLKTGEDDWTKEKRITCSVFPQPISNIWYSIHYNHRASHLLCRINFCLWKFVLYEQHLSIFSQFFFPRQTTPSLFSISVCLDFWGATYEITDHLSWPALLNMMFSMVLWDSIASIFKDSWYPVRCIFSHLDRLVIYNRHLHYFPSWAVANTANTSVGPMTILSSSRRANRNSFSVMLTCWAVHKF